MPVDLPTYAYTQTVQCPPVTRALIVVTPALVGRALVVNYSMPRNNPNINPYTISVDPNTGALIFAGQCGTIHVTMRIDAAGWTWEPAPHRTQYLTYSDAPSGVKADASTDDGQVQYLEGDLPQHARTIQFCYKNSDVDNAGAPLPYSQYGFAVRYRSGSVRSIDPIISNGGTPNQLHGFHLQKCW